MPMRLNTYNNRDELLEQLDAHLTEFEGNVPRIYTDSKGIATIGKGYALVVQGRDGKYKPALGRFENMFQRKPSARDKQLLQQNANILNSGAKNAVQQAQSHIPPFKSNEDSEAVDVSNL